MIYRAFYEDKANIWVNRYIPEQDKPGPSDHSYAKVLSRPANPPPQIPAAAAAQLRMFQYNGPPVAIPNPVPNPPPQPPSQPSQSLQPGQSALAFLQGAVPIGAAPSVQGPPPAPPTRFDFYLQ